MDEKKIQLTESESLVYFYISQSPGNTFFIKDIAKILNVASTTISAKPIKSLKNKGAFKKYKSSKKGVEAIFSEEFENPANIEITNMKNKKEFEKKIELIKKTINKNEEKYHLSDFIE
jgi:hypothetical protein